MTTINPAENLDILYFTLKKEQPQELELSLKNLLLDKLVRETKGQVKKNNVTMQEIVDEINVMRKERDEKAYRDLFSIDMNRLF